MIFPDADAVTGGASAPFGAGLGAERRHADRAAAWPAPGPTTAGWPSCAATAPSGAPASRSCRSSSTSTRRSPRSAGPASRGCAAASSSRRCGQPTRRTTTRATTRCGRRARSCRCRCTCTPASADRAAYGPHVGIYTTEVALVVVPAAVVPASGRACSSASPACASASPSAVRSGSTDLLWTMDLVYDREHGARKLGEQLTASMSMRPSEYFDRNCFIGASNTVRRRAGPPLRDRRRQPHAGATTSPTPRAPGRTPASSCATRSATSPSTRPRPCSGSTRPRCTASTSTRSGRSPTGSARRPTSSARTSDPTGQVGRRQAGRPPVAHRASRRGRPPPRPAA